jgi:hypothetical protein
MPLFSRNSLDFVVLSEAKDLLFAAESRSFASLDWITTLARRSE